MCFITERNFQEKEVMENVSLNVFWKDFKEKCNERQTAFSMNVCR